LSKKSNISNNKQSTIKPIGCHNAITIKTNANKNPIIEHIVSKLPPLKEYPSEEGRKEKKV